MAQRNELQIAQGSRAEIAAIIPIANELIFNTDDGSITLGDGVTANGIAHFENSYSPNTDWVSWTPRSIEAASGTFTSVNGNGSKYKHVGKIVFVHIQINIVTQGTAAGGIYVYGLPIVPTVAVSSDILVGREASFTGAMQTGTVGVSSGEGFVNIQRYDNAFPGAGDGTVLLLDGFYEEA